MFCCIDYIREYIGTMIDRLPKTIYESVYEQNEAELPADSLLLNSASLCKVLSSVATSESVLDDRMVTQI